MPASKFEKFKLGHCQCEAIEAQCVELSVVRKCFLH
jgi:hypothetical protein